VALPSTGAAPRELEDRAREFIDIDCERRGRGAWRVVFHSLAEHPASAEALEDDEDATTVIEGTWALAYVTDDGAIALSEARRVHIDNNQFYDVTRLRVAAHFDFDGDGHTELASRFGAQRYEERSVARVKISTFLDGRVQTYAPANAAAVIDEVRDMDEDGRPDLVSTQPYLVTTPFGVDGELSGGPLHVYRALADGTFSDQEPGALSLVRLACPQPPPRILPVSGSMEDAYHLGGLAVSCARIWGVPGEEISAQIRAELADACSDQGPHYTCSQLADILSTHATTLVPPQTLRP